MDDKTIAKHPVRRSSVSECEAKPDERLVVLEKKIRQNVRAAYPGRAGKEWLQACLRVLLNEEGLDGGTKRIDRVVKAKSPLGAQQPTRTDRSLARSA